MAMQPLERQGWQKALDHLKTTLAETNETIGPQDHHEGWEEAIASLERQMDRHENKGRPPVGSIVTITPDGPKGTVIHNNAHYMPDALPYSKVLWFDDAGHRQIEEFPDVCLTVTDRIDPGGWIRRPPWMIRCPAYTACSTWGRRNEAEACEAV